MKYSRMLRFVILLAVCHLFTIHPFRSHGAAFGAGTLRVVILGSSTAAGEAARPLDNSWANLFRNYLGTVYQSYEVVNLAVGGFTTFNVMPTGYQRPAPWNANTSLNVDVNKNITKALSLTPSLILINLPTNDCDLLVPLSQQFSNFDAIINAAQNAGVPVYLSTTQPRNTTQAVRTLLIEMRDALKNRYPGRVIDFWTGVANADGTIQSAYNYDGTHLNSAGHAILYERVRSTVNLSALPIQLATFGASVLQSSGNVLLNWSTASETENFGFEVQKSAERTNEYQTIPNGFVPGYGTTLEPHAYTFTDVTTSTGVWFYRLKQIDLDGTVHYSESVRVTALTGVDRTLPPAAFVLEQNYPNPFNPTTTIAYALPQSSHVTLTVHDILGRQVSLLVDDRREAGSHEVKFEAAGLAGGVYVYRLHARPLDSSIEQDSKDGSGEFVQSRRFVLLK